jgi:hypothetical protein
MPAIRKRASRFFKWLRHWENVEVITNKGIISTHSGWDNKLEKLRLSFCKVNHLNVIWVVEQ